MKMKVVSVLLAFSLLGNALLIWSLVSHQISVQNMSNQYSSTIESVDRSEQLVRQAMKETGSKQTPLLFQAFNLLTTAQLFEKSYERDFSQQGIVVANLTTFLADQSSNLSKLIGQQINGQPIHQEDLQLLDKNLQIIGNTLPQKYDQSQAFKDAFTKLHADYQ